ncbi:hypothetical protein JZ751_024798 [Albula glossodonta]|uniref:Mucolipin extracytosolic domain-containing protein n=1 Tax=Albula glossodonta TaxID=121402 RepID=A0A8T2PFD9_9TELE|nr:hypothetical protein JZ751_024798 [Albula glossodonta]
MEERDMEENGLHSDCEMRFVYSYCSRQSSKSEMEELEEPVAYTSVSDCSNHSSLADCGLDLDSDAVENLRRKLKYFFMNPCEKFKARGRKPWKLMLQILKIALITIQYAHLHNITVGNHAYERNDGMYTPLNLCQDFYKNGTIWPGNETFDINAQIETECVKIYPMHSLIENGLEGTVPNFTLDFKRLLSVDIDFTLKAINLQTVRHHELPDCYDFTVMEYAAFFLACHNKKLPWSERMEFINGWYILIIISDSLTIFGSILKIEIQTKNMTSYDVCSILLGTSTMLVWIGVIRYLGFFKKYNILILTLRAAFPNVIRFCCCVAMIYLGYCFCGWIFRTINTVSECLFSLINGDDMFPTFKDMQQKSYQKQRDGSPETHLQAFIAECKDLPSSGRYRIEEDSPSCLPCCCSRFDESEERLHC